MSERTKDEIKRELGALEDLLKDPTFDQVPRSKIHAQIRVLKEWSHLSPEEVFRCVDDAWPGFVTPTLGPDRQRDFDKHEAAEEMEDWLNGVWDLRDERHQDCSSPSEEWRKS